MKDLNTMTSDARSFDSTAGLTEEELRFLEDRLIQPREKQLIAQLFFPVFDAAPPWSKSVENDRVVNRNFRDEDNDQNEEFNNAAETDFQLVDQEVERRNHPIFKRVLGAVIPWDEIEAARALGRNINENKTNLLRTAHQRFLERLVWLGSNVYDLEGAGTTADATQVAPENANDWPTKIGNGNEDGLVRDITDTVEAVHELPGFEPPIDVAIPKDRFALASNTYIALDQGSELTVLDIARNNSNVGEIFPSVDLEDTDGVGQHTMVAADNREQFMDIVLPQAMMMMDPWRKKNDDVLIRTRQVNGGLRIKDAEAIAQMDGI